MSEFRRYGPPNRTYTSYYFDHFVGRREERGWNIEAEHLRSLHIDHQLKPGRLQDRQIRALCTSEDFPT
jgi:hypothetical protein